MALMMLRKESEEGGGEGGERQGERNYSNVSFCEPLKREKEKKGKKKGFFFLNITNP